MQTTRSNCISSNEPEPNLSVSRESNINKIANWWTSISTLSPHASKLTLTYQQYDFRGRETGRVFFQNHLLSTNLLHFHPKGVFQLCSLQRVVTAASPRSRVALVAMFPSEVSINMIVISPPPKPGSATIANHHDYSRRRAIQQ